MTIRLNTGARNAALDGILNTAFDEGVLEIRTGSQPSSADDEASGTLLVAIDLPADAFAAASNGSIAKQGTWEAAVGASGTPGWFRLRDGDDTIRIDGAVGSDMTISGLTGGDLIEGGTTTVDSLTITMPAS